MQELYIGEPDHPMTIKALTEHQSSSLNVYLEDIEGWDDFPEQERRSSEKISGNGSFVSGFMRHKARSLDVTFSAVSFDNVKSLRQKIIFWETSQDLFPLVLMRFIDGELNTEVIPDCYISGKTLWKQSSNGVVRVNMAFKSKHATKRLYIAQSPSFIEII